MIWRPITIRVNSCESLRMAIEMKNSEIYFSSLLMRIAIVFIHFEVHFIVLFTSQGVAINTRLTIRIGIECRVDSKMGFFFIIPKHIQCV